MRHWMTAVHSQRKGSLSKRTTAFRVRLYDALPSLLIGCLTVFAIHGELQAGSPVATEAFDFYPRYDENPEHLDVLRTNLQRALQIEPHAKNFLALAQVCFACGDVRAQSRQEKVSAYRCGREAAKKAIEMTPGSVPAHFWYATNTARLAQTQWGPQSLFYLRVIREEIQILFKLDPGFVPIYALAGDVYYELPGILGGDLDKAEAMFRKGLELDSKFTTLRLGLGKTLIRKGRIDEGKRELQKVLDEKEPRYRSDWVMKDSKAARDILEAIEKK